MYRPPPHFAGAFMYNHLPGIALDSACTHSAYRTSDVNSPILPARSNHDRLTITAATGDTVESYATAIQHFSAQSHPVNVFHDDQLTVP